MRGPRQFHLQYCYTVKLLKLYCKLPVHEKALLRSEEQNTNNPKCVFADSMTSILKHERAVGLFPVWRGGKENNTNKSVRKTKLYWEKSLSWTDFFFEGRYNLKTHIPLLLFANTLILDLKGKLTFLLSHCYRDEKCPLCISSLQYEAVVED